MPRAALRLIVVMAAVAAALAVGLPLLLEDSLEIPGGFLAVIALTVLAHLLAMQMRVGTSTIHVAWGEATIIVAFTLIPAAWMPAAVGLGILVGSSIRSFFGNGMSPVECVRATASLTLSAGVAAGLVIGTGIGMEPLTARAAITLAVAAMVYLFSTVTLLGLYLWVRDGQRFFRVIWSAISGTPVMIVGNLALGLLAALLWQDDNEQLFVFMLPPLLWLMYQLYDHRLREDEERRTWRAFAVASRSLHRLDEVAVAREGVRAARSLFAVRSVDLAVFGSQTRYWLELGSSNVENIPFIAPNEDGVTEPYQVTRPLEVAGAPVGMLTMSPMRKGMWSASDQHRLAAFGDGLAAALHDAATHSALRDLHERTTFESSHDPLTRLLNRDALLERGHALLRACSPAQPVALLLLDMDNFRRSTTRWATWPATSFCSALRPGWPATSTRAS
jgi:hypothetical protein